MSHVYVEFARINYIYANVTYTYGQFCDFYFYKSMVTGVNDTFVFVKRVTNAFVIFTGVTNTFIFVTFVKIALLLF